MSSERTSERVLTRKMYNHAIDVKEEFILIQWKVYPLSTEERGEVYEFIEEQLRKGYIRLSKLP